MKQKSKLEIIITLFIFVGMFCSIYLCIIGGVHYGVSSIEIENRAIDSYSTLTKAIDKSINNCVPSTPFTMLNSFFYRIVGKKTVPYSDGIIASDNEGYLYTTTESISAEQLFPYISEFKKLLDSMGSELIVCAPPTKYSNAKSGITPLLQDNTNEVYDELLSILSNASITYIDGRKIYVPDDVFYHTDHHWTYPAALQAAKATIEKISRLDIEVGTISEKDLQRIVCEDLFCGTFGIPTYFMYEKRDEFVYYIPNYETDFTVYQYRNEQLVEERSGSFEDSIIYYEAFNPDLFDSSTNSYDVYLKYVDTEKRLVNNQCDNSTKVLIIGDSYSRPYGSFIALGVKEVRILDVRTGQFDNVINYILEYKPDVVITMFHNANYQQMSFVLP